MFNPSCCVKHLGMLILLLVGMSAALAVRPSLNTVLRSVPTPGEIKIDGNLDDWDTSGEILICDDLDNPLHAVRVATMYDDIGLYLSFRFFDLTPMINHTGPGSGQAWCGDAVQLRFWTEPEKPIGPPEGGRVVHIDCNWSTDEEVATAYVVVGSMQQGQVTEKAIGEAVGNGLEAAFIKQEDERGYTQEMRIDWKMLRRDGLAYRPGESLRLGIESFWGDIASSQSAAYRVVDLINAEHPQRDFFWMNHLGWGKVDFVAAGNLPITDTAKEFPRVEEMLAKVVPTIDPILDPPVPVVDPNKPSLPYQGDEKAGALVNAWFKEGTAAGNNGDFYDNRDRAHSMLDLRTFPQLQLQRYTAKERIKGDDYVTAKKVLPYVAIGNSSTSGQPNASGCNPRSLYLNQSSMDLLYQQYRGNNLFVYPAHLDYRLGHNGRVGYGDLMPSNSPYLLTSQGSSGSDQAFLSAVTLTMAAFAPDVKKELIKQGLLMPTVQALLRQTYAGTKTPEEYLTGKANPPVFNGSDLDPERMVQLAHTMKIATIPPMIQLQTMKDGKNRNQRGRWAAGSIVDTPATIAFVHRQLERDLHFTISAKDSFDLNKKTLSFRWVILQGDPARIQIVPSADGSEAEITIAYHERFAISPGSALESNRVDIGVFAYNGDQYSAPGFITVAYGDNDLRTYDAQGRIIDFNSAGGDTTIGYDTKMLIPTGEVPIYDISDWGAAFACALGDGQDFAGQMLRAHLSADDRQLLQQSYTEYKVSKAEFDTAKARIMKNTTISYNDQWIELDRLVQATCLPLWRTDPTHKESAKDIIERALNTVKNDMQLYLRYQATIDSLVDNNADAKAKAAISSAKERLQMRGILLLPPDDQPAWHSVRSGSTLVEQRLTKYETFEIKSFNHLLVSRLFFPQFLHTRVVPNYYDQRLSWSQDSWQIYRYGVSGKLIGVMRITDN